MKKGVIMLFFILTILGAFCGLMLYGVLMFSGQNFLLYCVLAGSVFGLITACASLFFVRNYINLKIRHQKLKQELRSDTLTGLLNRRAFDDDIRMEYGDRYSMIFLDVDNFSLFNNTYGHQVGDRMLTIFADIIKSRTRQSDLVYRYGGEEVIVILPDCAKTDAGQIAQNIMDGLRSHDFSPYPSLTVSAGIAAKPEDATSLKRLIKASDSALLQAKQRGKNQLAVYSADVNDI